MTPSQFEKFYQNLSKFDQSLGLRLKVISPREIQYSLKICEEHLSSPQVCHGGVIAGMMDATLGVGALAYAVTQNKLCSTVEFKINYLGPAHLGEILIGKSQIDFIGKRLVVTNATISSGNQPIAKGMGTFNLYPMEKNKYLQGQLPQEE